jgi:PTS system nitrogen regulatory IIA component
MQGSGTATRAHGFAYRRVAGASAGFVPRKPILLDPHGKSAAMGITEHLSAADVILDLGAGNKRAALERLASEAASRSGRPEQEILDAIQARESLGSTALGRGVALPHARLEGDAAPLALFARLQRPVDFEARDEVPVDLVVMVLWPEAAPEGFLPALSETCRAMRDPQILRRLRATSDPAEVVSLLAGTPPAVAE